MKSDATQNFRYLKAQDLTSRTGIPEGTWAKYRTLNRGPKWLKVGKHALYRESDFEAWLRSKERLTREAS